MSQQVSIIVAVADNGVIGNAGGIPWHLSTDLKRFKRITMGHHLIMGRKTWDSLGRALPGRTSIVLSRRKMTLDDVHVVDNLPAALEIACADSEVFVIGGSEIYKLALPHTDRIYLTRVHATIDGDTILSDTTFAPFRTVESEEFSATERDDYGHTFELLVRNIGDRHDE